MNTEQVARMEAKVQAALEQQSRLFDEKIASLTNQLSKARVSAPQIETFQEVEIVPWTRCDEPLHVAKSIPEFDGISSSHTTAPQDTTRQ